MSTPNSDVKSEVKPEVKEVHYVVVVHGIGEQRPNETVPAVISRFAEARKMDFLGLSKKEAASMEMNGFVSMGKIAAQAGTKKREGKIDFAGERPWSQFEGIPKDFGAEVGNFNAIKSEGEGDIRFVDMFWADILDDYFKISGQTVEAWTDGVLSRMKNAYDHEDSADSNEKKYQKWVIQVLTHVQETALFATNVAGLPKVDIADELNHVMDSVVGDIQIYGENGSVRGEAVARFHGLMEKIHEQHLKTHKIYNYDASEPDVQLRYAISKDSDLYEQGIRYVRPKIHIVAHSLGTVMSLDAIMYAHVKKSAAYPGFEKDADFEGKYRNLPFEMYSQNHLKKVPWDVKEDKPLVKNLKDVKKEEYVPRTEGECIGSNWIDNIDSFVTLGSPIDKFLVLYPENYEYLNGVLHGQNENDPGYSKSEAARNVFLAREGIDIHKIRHYNYCDEQDPVGHHLDLVNDKAAYNLIFNNAHGDRDVVFNQYVTPGVAHIKYWEDLTLMRRILHQTVDGDPVAPALNNVSKKTQAPEGSGSDFTEEHSPSANYAKVIQITYFWPILISGLVMSGVFYWGWQSMKSDPNNYWIPALAAFIFSMSGYLFRKIIALLVWWRQSLRTKSETGKKGYVINRASSTKEHKRLSKWFRYTINGGVIAMPLFSVLSISYALINSGVLKRSSGSEAILTYFGMLITGGLVVYLYGKSKWSRSYGKRSSSSKAPEWITVGFITGITLFVYLIVHFLGDTVEDWIICIDDAIISAIAILIAGLTIAWIYVRYTLFYVKRELTDARTPTQIKMGKILASMENKLSGFFEKHTLHILLGLFAIALLYVVFASCL